MYSKNKFFNNLSLVIKPATIGSWDEKVELLRRLARDSQPGHILLCILLGITVGLVTIFLHEVLMFVHSWAFGLEDEEHLSAARNIKLSSILTVPIFGGAALGIFLLLTRRWKKREIIDPIEANAIYGGRMSMFDNIRLLFSTIISNTAGTSIGMEAAYTQIGGGFCSYIGQNLHLRRQDLRIFVAAGSAAAIAAAFNAPFAGAFYGFELVLGVYSISALSQVSAAALASTVTLRVLTPGDPMFSIPDSTALIQDWHYPIFMILGALSAIIGIFTMKSVTECEHLAKKMPLPDWLRPLVGGIIVALIAAIFPQVLGGGQGAIDYHLHEQWGFTALCLLMLFKIAASAVSIGFGFKGGLFSSSLLIGCLFGQITGIISSRFFPEVDLQYINFTLVGMASVAASIVGAPVTMTMLILETTGNFAVSTGVLAGVLISSAITRYYFGYSFSTWRFHLRGLRIKGAHDVGWVKDIPAEKLMNNNAKTINPKLTLAEFRKQIPLGSVKRVFVVDDNKHYKGVIDVISAYNHDLDKDADNIKVGDLAIDQDKFLLPHYDIKIILERFSEFQTEELPVLKSENNDQIIGFISESYVLRKYTQELEIHNMDRA